MKSFLKYGLLSAALIAGSSLAVWAAGGAGTVLTSVAGTDLVPIDSGTLAADAPVSVLGTYFASNLGNITVGTGVNQITLTGDVTTAIPDIAAGGTSSDTNIGISLSGKGTGAVLIGGATTTLAGLQVAQPASRVNDWIVTPAATGNTPGIEAGGAGSDASVGATFGTVGTGPIAFDTDFNVQQFGITRTASAVDYLACTGSATGTPGTPGCTATGTDSNININLTPKGSGIVRSGAAPATCSGTTTATCQGQIFVVTITGLVTAASATSAAMTVTDATVVASSNLVACVTQGYAGTGIPIVVNTVPGTGSVALKIQNVSTAAALNANVVVACQVFG